MPVGLAGVVTDQPGVRELAPPLHAIPGGVGLDRGGARVSVRFSHGRACWISFSVSASSDTSVEPWRNVMIALAPSASLPL